jgi:hypothetical protein
MSLITALIASVAVCLVFVGALICIGIPFHWSIGGTL